MESAKIFGSEEECRSCESGWTMYLVSPSHDHDDYYYGDDEDHHHHAHDGSAHHHHHHLHHEEDYSDGDSMASDASSGPMEATSRLQLLNRTQERNCDYGLSLTEKTRKPVMKKKKKMKTNPEEVHEERVFTKTRVPKIFHNNDDDDDDDHSSAVHSCVGSVKP